MTGISVFTYSSVSWKTSTTTPASRSYWNPIITTLDGATRNQGNIPAFRDPVLIAQTPISPCSSLVASEKSGFLGHLLSVDILYGDLSFPAAKFIDLLWVMVFGRGTQALMAWAMYHLLMGSVGWITESRPVSYELLVSATMSAIDWSSLLPLRSIATTKQAIHHKLLVYWLMFAIFWVVTFPTVVSAMTGYVNFVDPSQNTLVKLKVEGQYMNLTEFRELAETAFQLETEDGDEAFESITVLNNSTYHTLWESLNATLAQPVSYPSVANASQTVFSYHCSQNNSYCPNGVYEANVTCFRRLAEQLYPWAYTESLDNVICLQGFNYQWGFSSVMIMVFLCCNTFWIVGMFITWEVLINKSHFMKKPRLLGKYRALVDLGEAIRKELGPDISAQSDSALERELKKRPPIRYHVFKSEKHGSGHPHIGLSPDNPNGPRIRLDRDILYC